MACSFKIIILVILFFLPVPCKNGFAGCARWIRGVLDGAPVDNFLGGVQSKGWGGGGSK